MLESKDWRYEIKNGVDVAIYIPNEKAYDYTFLVRIHPFCKDIIKEYRQDDLSSVDKVNLYNKLASYSWTFDIPGYIPNSDLARVIKYKYIIPRGARFGKATMDAQNYYVHAHDMYDLKSFIKNHTEPK